MPRNLCLFLAASAVFGLSAPATFADIDNVVTLVPNAVAAGGTSNSLGSYGYVESLDENSQPVKTFYTATFGAGAAIRRIAEGSATATTVANEGDLQLFYRNGDPSRGVTTPTVSGLITNPATVGGINPNSALWITDIATTRVPGGAATVDPEATKRLYRFNLQTIGSGGTLTSLATSASLATGAGLPASTANNFGRQAAFSPTGQTIYAVDTSATLGGVHKIDPVTGVSTRILEVTWSGTGSNRLSNEPAVLRVGNVDRVLISGNRQSTGGTDFNNGGLNYIDHDGTTTSAQQVLIAAADLKAFLQTTAESSVNSIAAASDGTIFFWDGGTSRMLARDSQGRLYKVSSRSERDLALTADTATAPAPSNSVLRLQTRTITHPTAGAITQLMYMESTPLNFVAGINIFKPTDFDRDGDETVADMASFATVLTVNGAPSALPNARFDLNGNGSVDYNDVRTAQSFQLFPDGDSNFDRAVDFDDLVVLAQSYSFSGKTWFQGDFTGNNLVDFDDLVILAQHYGEGAPPLAGFSAAFAADWALAQSLVPEPATLSAVAVVSGIVARRRRAV